MKLKNTITKLKNILKGFNSRLGEVEERIGKLEDKAIKHQTEQKIIIKYNNEDNLRDLWDNIKWNNICFTGVPDREEREREKDRKLI